MKNLLVLLGLKKETIGQEVGLLEPVCNISPKTNYINTLYLESAQIEKEKGRRLTSDEFTNLGNSIQQRLGVRVVYNPGYI